MRLPTLTPTWLLLALLAFLMVGTVLHNKESLRFCEEALYGEFRQLPKQKAMAFTEVCPEVRQRTENSINKWLEIILALLVQFHPPTPRP